MGVFARATRAKTLPLVLVPVGIGSALASADGPLSWGVLGLCVVGAAGLHLGAYPVCDVFDARSGVDRLTRMDRAGIATSPGFVDDGTLGVRATLSIAAGCYAAAAASGAALAVERGAGVLAFGAAGFLLGLCYAAPPVRYGYRGRGLGEAGFFVAYGLLPVGGSYFAQTGRLDASAIWASLVPGLLTAVALGEHNLLHPRADKGAGRRTLPVVIGSEGALLLYGLGILAAYSALLLQPVTGLYPAWAAAGIVTAFPVAAAWVRAFRDPLPQRCLQLFGASLGASVIAGAIIALSLATR